jgi:DNA invertase Pin-like site-specific DNA recombinase
MTKRAVIYTRVSSEEQATEGTSLEVQRERALAYCVAQGWEAVEVFTDAGVSGAKADRPALLSLMQAVDAGHVDVVVVAKMDRLARSMRHLSPLLGRLDDAGVALVSIAESFDSASPAGRLMRNMLGSMAEWERDVIRDRTTSGRLVRINAGGWSGGAPPLGFRVEGQGKDAKLVLDDAEAAMVRRAVGLLLDQGLTTGEASEVLNAEGYLPRKAPRWTAALLRNHLMRGPWGGVWTYAKPSKRTKTEAIRVAVPPLLDAERHAALLSYLKKTATVRTRAAVHPLSGLLEGVCGHAFHGLARQRGRRRYRCSHHKMGSTYDACLASTVLAQPLDDLVWAEVLQVLADREVLMAAAEDRLDLLAGLAEEAGDGLDRAKTEVAQLERALGEVFARGVQQGLDDATLDLATETLKRKLAAARLHVQQVTSMQAETAQQADWLENVQQVAALAQERLQAADDELRALVLRLLDVKVRMTAPPDGSSVPGLEITGTVFHRLLAARLDVMSPQNRGVLSLLNRTSR